MIFHKNFNYLSWPGEEETGAVWNSENHRATILDGLRATGRASFANGVWYYNDPDVVFLVNSTSENSKRGNYGYDGRASLEQIKTWTSFVGLSGGLVFTSEPLEDEICIQNLRMFEILNPPYVGGATLANFGIDTDFTQWGYRWELGDIKSVSFMIWNSSVTAANVMPKSQFILNLGTDFHVWSFWDRKYYGVGTDAFKAMKLEPGCNFTLKLTEHAPTPLIIGSDLHISMGAAELKSYYVMESRLIVELNKCGCQAGSLYIYSENLLLFESSENVSCSLCKVEENIYQLALSERNGNIQKIVLRIKNQVI